jgi:microsomal epoxide hydrolase
LHVVHADGRGPNPVPLLLTHGWPGSFLDYLELLARTLRGTLRPSR